MNNIFFRDNITFAIALIGFLLSVFNTIYLLFANRRNLQVVCKNKLECNNLPDKPIFFELIFKNDSLRNITVLRLFLHIGDESFETFSFPEAVYHEQSKTGSVITSERTVYSPLLPQTLPGRCSICGFYGIHTTSDFNFEKLNNSDSYLAIHTDRGLIKHILTTDGI